MYVYASSGRTVVTYIYDKHFDLTQNGPMNTFSAGPGSGMSHAPHDITAMSKIFNQDRVLAFVGIMLYVYDAATQHWSDEGDVVTPC